MYRSPIGKDVCACLLMVAAACLAGCGESGRGGLEVTGLVTLDGQPMQEGSVVFVPLASGHKTAGKITAGQFRIPASDGPIPGSYRVEVYAPDASPVPLDDPLAYAQSAPRLPPANPVASRFNTQSELTAEVAAGRDNQFTFEVQSATR
jgi:hypothetical protein